MNCIEKYLKYREELTKQYIRGDMTKREYLQSNLNAVLSLNIEPFENADMLEKALFNYQYYNALAKEAKMESFKAIYKEDRWEFTKEANFYYKQKDKATLKILKLLDFSNVEAYFIKVRSKELKGKLVEIVVSKYNAILHSTNINIISLLKKENVFHDGIKNSLIDTYINQKY